MNFSPATIQAAAGYVSAVKRALEPLPRFGSYAGEVRRRGGVTLAARARAIAWGGLTSEELNALARIAGHPFAPELPEWMRGGAA